MSLYLSAAGTLIILTAICAYVLYRLAPGFELDLQLRVGPILLGTILGLLVVAGGLAVSHATPEAPAPMLTAPPFVARPVIADDPVDTAEAKAKVEATGKLITKPASIAKTVAADSLQTKDATKRIGGAPRADELIGGRYDDEDDCDDEGWRPPRRRAKQCETWRGERVVHLPEDGRIYYLTVFTHVDWRARARDREVLSWFDVHPDLAALRAQCHFRHITPADPGYPIWAGSVGGDFPCVALQHGSGAVQAPIYKASGSQNFPNTAGDLAAELLTVAAGSPCTPKPPYVPAPNLRPFIQPVQPVVPDVRPPLSALNEQLLTYALVAIIVVGVLAFLVAFAMAWVGAFKKKHSA